MQKIKFFLSILAIGFILNSCEMEGLDSDNSFLETVTASDQQGILDISNDNSGNVKITPVSNGISKSVVHFGDGSGIASTAVVTPGNSITHKYAEGSYTVTIDYYDLAGNVTSQNYPFQIIYRAPENLAINTDIQGLTVKVSAVSDFSNGYQVYFGDVPNEIPTPMENGDELTHVYSNGGNYTITVVALSGGAATTTATKEIQVYAAYSLPVTFEDPNQNYNIGGVFGGVQTEILANPNASGLNTSSMVWKFVKGQGAETWAGTWTPLAEPGGVPININNGQIFKILVYATETGKSVHFQLEDGTDYKPGVDVPITVANQWQELTFDFSSLNIPEGHIFNQYVVQYNLAEGGMGEVIYLDNIRQTN